MFYTQYASRKDGLALKNQPSLSEWQALQGLSNPSRDRYHISVYKLEKRGSENALVMIPEKSTREAGATRTCRLLQSIGIDGRIRYDLLIK